MGRGHFLETSFNKTKGRKTRTGSIEPVEQWLEKQVTFLLNWGTKNPENLFSRYNELTTS